MRPNFARPTNNIGNWNKMPKVKSQRISSTKYALKPITGEIFKVLDNFKAN
ncbi:hypothetical protein SASC256_09800 [Staphylococcus argenteus]|nr:hypothetical protein SA19061_21070 [Staphylococcus argenteus]GJF53729.1 hypothetical protein SA19088_04720 [Staphylococcus argenteus]GJF73370.1 hypothetical protein SA19202_19780 [Staphylococcus argenteus]GJF84946.1 hypothetical protein SA20015_06550 [Staphylococcus argenteus]GJF95864.1 hypothetical protein SASC252_13230 [Staphylococcus argenteus]